MTYLRAKDIWQVKHLNGLTLVSVDDRSIQEVTTMGVQWNRHTSKNVSFKVFVPGEGLATVGTEDHDGGRSSVDDERQR